jgi:hypothetical protein
MKRVMIRFILVLIAVALSLPGISHAQGIEWNLKKQLQLKSSPLDVASSVDGKWIFVLTPGEILVYSDEGDVVERIPVEKTFDHLTYSVPDRTLIASSSADKTLKIIHIEAVQHFTLEGLPFFGAKNAPVTLVVFSDYQ